MLKRFIVPCICDTDPLPHRLCRYRQSFLLNRMPLLIQPSQLNGQWGQFTAFNLWQYKSGKKQTRNSGIRCFLQYSFKVRWYYTWDIDENIPDARASAILVGHAFDLIRCSSCPENEPPWEALSAEPTHLQLNHWNIITIIIFISPTAGVLSWLASDLLHRPQQYDEALAEEEQLNLHSFFLFLTICASALTNCSNPFRTDDDA